MKLKFVVNENYLITHTLSSMNCDRFLTVKHKKDIVAFQNYAWKKSKKLYNFITGRLLPDDVTDKNIKLLSRELPSFLATLKKNRSYKKILSQTENYLSFCKNQWNKNYEVSNKIIRELTGLNFNKTFTVYITHPSLRNGHYLGDNKIAWGHNEDWKNYATVYLWHEVLHSYFTYSDLDHVIIQLITDEELRTQLNGGKYPPFVGHKNLTSLTKKVVPYWDKYLKSRTKNIMKFRKTLMRSKLFQT